MCVDDAHSNFTLICIMSETRFRQRVLGFLTDSIIINKYAEKKKKKTLNNTANARQSIPQTAVTHD